MTTRHPAAIAAGHPDTVAAAETVLDAGGNAFDAIVAAGFASAVAEPGLTSLGGGGFVLACPQGDDEVLVDFFVDTPGRGRAPGQLTPHFTPVTIAFRGTAQVFHAGDGSVAVPGCLPGYLHVHRRWGRLGLDEVLAPARRLAVDGVVLNVQQGALFGLLEAIFTLTDEGRMLFAPQGHVLGVGERFVNPALADVLDSIAAGRIDGFASPALADPLLAAMEDHHGLLTTADLAAYQVVERPPLAVPIGDAVLLTNPPPSFGGTLVAATLARCPLGAAWDTPEAVVAVADAMVAVDGQHRRHAPAPDVRPDRRADDRSDHQPDVRPQSRRGTTHISVADHEGNVAAMTTSNGSGSGVFAPGTGIHLNNIMGEDDLHPDGFHAAAPGLRVGSMMAPGLLALADGRRVALGSGGSERIRSALTLAIGHLVTGADLADAVGRPRLHWDGSTLQVEPGWPDEVVAALARHHPINVWDATDLYFGGVHAASDGGEAAGDPRRGGSTSVRR